MTTEEKYKKALEKILSMSEGMSWKAIFNVANDALNLPHQYETISVLKWMCPICCKILPVREGWAIACDEHCHIASAVKLTGTYERKIPPKVTRREEIAEGEGWYWLAGDLQIKRPANPRFYVEWEE